MASSAFLSRIRWPNITRDVPNPTTSGAKDIEDRKSALLDFYVAVRGFAITSRRTCIQRPLC